MDKQLKDYFDTYPSSGQVFQTADGFLFHQDYDAKAHARSLANKVVNQYARPTDSVTIDGMTGKIIELPAGQQLAPVMQPLTNEPGAPLVEIARKEEKGIDATAPVVADESGAVISPAVGETSTSPVAATQIVTEGHKVLDAGTVDAGATTEEAKAAVQEMAADTAAMEKSPAEQKEVDAQNAAAPKPAAPAKEKAPSKTKANKA